MDKSQAWLYRRKLKKGVSYQVQWVDLHSGRVKSRAVGSDKVYAYAQLKKLRDDMRLGIDSSISPMDWDDFTMEHLSSLQVRVDCRDTASGTYVEVELVLRQLGLICSPRTTQKVSYAMMERFVTARLKAGTSKATVNKNLRTLRAVFNRAVSCGYMEKNPLSKSPLFLKVPKVVKRTCTDDEIKALLDACQDDRWLAFCLIAVRAGFRRGEIVHLEWDDIDFQNDMLHIRYKDNWQPKGSKERSVPMSAPIREVLLRLLPNRFKCSYVILNNIGGPLRYNISQRFARIVKAASLVDEKNPITPHALRRTFATTVAQEASPKVLMELMGHEKLETTMAYYVDAKMDEKRKAVAQISA